MENSNFNDLLGKKGVGDTTSESLSDETVIKNVKEGNTHQFSIIVKRHNQQLFRIIRSYLNNRKDVEDAMQTTYLKAFKNLKQFRSESKFSTWLIRIGINEALKQLNKRNKLSDLYSVTNDYNADQNNKTDKNTPESQVIKKDMNSHLEKAIDTIPPKYRSVLIMRKIEELSTEETADILDITQSNVKIRLHRAKNMLRDKLTEMLGDIDLFSYKGDDCDRMTNQVMSIIDKEA